MMGDFVGVNQFVCVSGVSEVCTSDVWCCV